MSLHHERQRAQHGHPLHRDHTEDLETGIANAVREIDELHAERDQLRNLVRAASVELVEQRAQLESIREYVQLLRDLERAHEDVGTGYLARIYADTASALERKIGDRT